jgi:hypothetical protein
MELNGKIKNKLEQSRAEQSRAEQQHPKQKEREKQFGVFGR